MKFIAKKEEHNAKLKNMDQTIAQLKAENSKFSGVLMEMQETLRTTAIQLEEERKLYNDMKKECENNIIFLKKDVAEKEDLIRNQLVPNHTAKVEELQNIVKQAEGDVDILRNTLDEKLNDIKKKEEEFANKN